MTRSAMPQSDGMASSSELTPQRRPMKIKAGICAGSTFDAKRALRRFIPKVGVFIKSKEETSPTQGRIAPLVWELHILHDGVFHNR